MFLLHKHLWPIWRNNNLDSYGKTKKPPKAKEHTLILAMNIIQFSVAQIHNIRAIMMQNENTWSSVFSDL